MTVMFVCLKTTLGVMQKYWVTVSDVDGKVTVNDEGVTSKWSGFGKMGVMVCVPSWTGIV